MMRGYEPELINRAIDEYRKKNRASECDKKK